MVIFCEIRETVELTCRYQLEDHSCDVRPSMIDVALSYSAC